MSNSHDAPGGSTPPPHSDSSEVTGEAVSEATHRDAADQSLIESWLKSSKRGGENLDLRPGLSIVNTSKSQIIKDIHTVWDQSKFSITRQPVLIGVLKDQSRFDTAIVPQAVSLEIKSPRSHYSVPQEFSQFKEAIQRIINHEHVMNQYADMYYAYLTIDQRWIAETLKTEEKLSAKQALILSPQTAEIQPKTQIDHAYVVSNRLPLSFYVQPFDLNRLDPETESMTSEIRKQAIETRTLTPNAYEIYLIDAYNVYRATQARENCFRTFLKVEYTVRKRDIEE